MKPPAANPIEPASSISTFSSRLLPSLLLPLLLSFPAPATAQGIAYSAGVEGARMNWGDELGLDDTALLGAFATMEFGRYVRLQLGLARANNVDTRLGDLGFPAAENRVDVTRAATRVLLRLGSRSIAPLLAGSAGVMRLDPDGRESVDQLFVGWGGGIALRPLSWLNAQFLLEDVRMRLDRSGLSPDPAAGPDPEADDRRGSLMASLGLALRVGGWRASRGADEADRAMSGLTSGRVEGLLVPLELRGGILRFDDAFQVDDQPTAAVSLGVGLGPYFGLRGSYLRGGSDALGTLDGWSGEAVFSLGRMTSLSPYLLLGYGEVSFDEDFLNDAGNPVPDQGAFMAGAGIGVALSDRMRLTASLKDYITTAGDLDQASSTSELRHSFGLEAGLSYLLVGRRADTSVPAALEDLQEEDAPVAVVAEERAPEAQPDSMPRLALAGVDTVEVIDTVQVVDTVRVGLADTVVADTLSGDTLDTGAADTVAADTAVGDTAVADTAAEAAPADTLAGPPPATPDSADTGYQSDRTIVIPLPSEGEIYIRYGPPPARDSAGTGVTPSLPVSPTIPPPAPAADTAAPADTVEAAASTTAAADTAALALIVRRELERLLGSGTGGAATPGGAAVSGVVGPARASVAADTTEDRIDRLAEEVRLLTQLLREGATVRSAGEEGGTVVALPVTQGDGVTRVTTVQATRPGYLLDAGLGWGSHRDGGAGLSATVDLSRRDPWWWLLRPYAGVELTWSSVEPTVGTLTANGSVTTFAAGVGSYLDLPRVGPVTPSLSLGLQGMGGSVSGDTPDDQEILDALHDAFSLGVNGGIHLAYQRPEGRNLITLALRRHWAGDRSRWSLQGGLRFPIGGGRGTPAGTVRLVPGAPGPSEVTFEVGERAPAADPRMTGEDRRGDPTTDSPAFRDAGTDSTVLARIDSLEQALDRERRARLEAREAAGSDRRQTERDGEALRSALDAVAATFPGLLQVGERDGRTVVTLGGGAFQVASATLAPRSQRAVEQVADLLRSASRGPVLVEGHTDATGPEETNLALSRARAQAVRAILVQQGVEGSRIEALGMGEAEPVATNESADGRSRNRRVEIHLMGGAGTS